MTTPIYRVATLSDVDGIAECAAEAMMEDDLFGALWPRRKEYPEQFVAYFRRRARERILDHTVVNLVSEIPVQENGKEVLKVVGMAQWQKFGKPTVETGWSPTKEMMTVKGPDGEPIPSPVLIWKNPDVQR